MSLTALLADGSIVDASTDDAPWGLVHRNREARLRCPSCGGRLVAKQMFRSGLRFFAHHAPSSKCHLSRETMAHRLLKLELAAACRRAGWNAALEVVGPEGRWRADVLATSIDGGSYAFEAQLSGLSVEDNSQAAPRDDRGRGAGAMGERVSRRLVWVRFPRCGSSSSRPARAGPTPDLPATAGWRCG